MSKQKDFATKYAPKVFAIYPASSFNKSGCGWAIINCDARSYGGNKNSPLVLRSGCLKPFAELSSLSNMTELAHKLARIWQEDCGFSRQPKTVVIEQPVTYPGSPVNPKSIRDLAILVGILTQIFTPQLILTPTEQEWSTGASKENNQKEILNHSDKISLSNIKRDMDCLALHNRHNVYDAIGLGIYGGHVTNRQLPLPEAFYGVNLQIFSIPFRSVVLK